MSVSIDLKPSSEFVNRELDRFIDHFTSNYRQHQDTCLQHCMSEGQRIAFLLDPLNFDHGGVNHTEECICRERSNIASAKAISGKVETISMLKGTSVTAETSRRLNTIKNVLATFTHNNR